VTNLAPHPEKCIFIGYTEEYKAWRFWSPTQQAFTYPETSSGQRIISTILSGLHHQHPIIQCLLQSLLCLQLCLMLRMSQNRIEHLCHVEVKLARHVLSSLVITQLHQSFASVPLCMCLELLEGHKGITLLLEKTYPSVSGVVINEEDPVAKARGSWSVQRAMDIDGQAQEVGCCK
jgi:hypothetical protein